MKEKGGKGSKGKGKGRAVADEEDEEDGDEENIGATVEIDKRDTLCDRAIIGFCRMNVLSPPADMVFGSWNNRPLKETEAMKLAKQMRDTKFAPFARANLLPLIISRDHVEESCLQKEVNVEMAPMLELTEQAMLAGTKFQFAGGRHRKRATEILRSKSVNKVTNLEEKIAQLKESSKTIKESKLHHLEGLLKDERDINAKIGIWGIIIYDKGEEICR